MRGTSTTSWAVLTLPLGGALLGTPWVTTGAGHGWPVGALVALALVWIVALLGFLRLRHERPARRTPRVRDALAALRAIQRTQVSLAGAVDAEALLQAVTDAATELSGARYGAFFRSGQEGDAPVFCTFSGAPREAFERFAIPRAAPLLAATLAGRGVVRCDDVARDARCGVAGDPRYGRAAPRRGAAAESVRSCLAVPVVSPGGRVQGGLFLGHPDPGVFDAGVEEIVRAVAAQAGVALENARLHERVRRSEERYRLLTEAAPHMTCTLDPGGVVEYVSRSWTRFTGVSLAAVRREGWSALLPEGERRATLARLAEKLARGEPHELRFRLRRADGEPRWVLWRALPVLDRRGRARRWICTTSDVQEQVEAEEALRAADRRKDESLAMLAHELRGPLSGLCSALELLRLGRDEALVERSAAMMGRQVGQLARLVDDLLDASRIRRGTLRLQRARVELAGVVATAVEATQELFAAGGHALALDVPEALVLDADPVRLAQVLQNLLANAARYTPPGGHVALRARRERGALCLAVQDDGIGIAPERQEEVFEMFCQLEGDSPRAARGLGIGLALVRLLVELHGGRVAVRSAGVGRGATFEVRLPLPVEDAPPSRERAAHEPGAGAARAGEPLGAA